MAAEASQHFTMSSTTISILRTLFAALALLFAATAVMAQENFGAVTFGYVHEHLDEGTGSAELNGWNAGTSIAIRKWLSAAGDVSNYYGSFKGRSQNIHTFLFGPVFSYPNPSRFVPFGLVIAGDSRGSIGGTITNAFEVGVGVGLNIKLNKRVLVKILPAEYLLTTPKGNVRNSYKAAAGLEFPIPRSLFKRK